MDLTSEANRPDSFCSATAEQRVRCHGIRPTALRLLILSALDNRRNPVSALDLELELDTVDRSTITRTLAVFAEKGLIHLIDDGTGIPKYESCPSCHHHIKEDMHVHFHCQSCGRTYCLPEIAVPQVELPADFIVERTNYTLTGICSSCSMKR